MSALKMLLVGVLTLLVCACVTGGGLREIEAGAGEAGPRLIMVRNHAVNSFTGMLVRKYDVANRWQSAMPVNGRPGWYEIEGGPSLDQPGWDCLAYHVNPTDDKFERIPIPVSWSFDHKDRVIVRMNDDGSERWRFAQPGQRVKMGDDRLVDRNYMPIGNLYRNGTHYVAYMNSLVALSDETGNELWRVPQYCSKVLEGDEFLLASFHETKDGKTHVDVRALAYDTGTEIFRIPVGEGSWYPERLFRTGDCYGVEIGSSTKISLPDGRSFDAPESTRLFYPDGRIALQVPERIHSILWASPERVVLSGTKSVSCWKTGGELHWKVDAKHERLQREFFLLPDGDVIACEYAPIAASNDVVTRLDSETGKPKWTTTCETPPVSHSKYSHEVYLELIDGKLIMCSQQSGAVFVEVLDPANGKQLHRWVLTDKLGE